MPDYLYTLPPWRGPLAPIARLKLSRGALSTNVTALLDTGADYTQIPLEIATDLRLPRVREKRVDDAGGSTKTLWIHRGDVEFAGIVFRDLLVLADDFDPNGEPWGLVGRDILNQVVVLDGPRGVYSVATASGATAP